MFFNKKTSGQGMSNIKIKRLAHAAKIKKGDLGGNSTVARGGKRKNFQTTLTQKGEGNLGHRGTVANLERKKIEGKKRNV